MSSSIMDTDETLALCFIVKSSTVSLSFRLVLVSRLVTCNLKRRCGLVRMVLFVFIDPLIIADKVMSCKSGLV